MKNEKEFTQLREATKQAFRSFMLNRTKENLLIYTNTKKQRDDYYK